MHKNVYCDHSYEPSRQDGSDGGSQHMVSMRNKKISLNTPSYLELCLNNFIRVDLDTLYI